MPGHNWIRDNLAVSVISHADSGVGRQQIL